ISDLEDYFGKVSLISPSTDTSPLMFKLVACAPRPIDEIFPKFDCMELPPTIYKKDRERIHLLISSESGNSFVEEVENLDTVDKVVLKKLSPFKSSETKYPIYISISDVMSQLTQRQIHSLILAVKKGYYEIPRKTGTEELAKNFDISRRTFEEHLRKAEKKLVENFVPLMLFNVNKEENSALKDDIELK
ncbi:MAG: helix-turn-helix domain-containing protein, partial [Candidatus Hodarchaeales archaeon]